MKDSTTSTQVFAANSSQLIWQCLEKGFQIKPGKLENPLLCTAPFLPSEEPEHIRAWASHTPSKKPKVPVGRSRCHRKCAVRFLRHLGEIRKGKKKHQQTATLASPAHGLHIPVLPAANSSIQSLKSGAGWKQLHSSGDASPPTTSHSSGEMRGD